MTETLTTNATNDSPADQGQTAASMDSVYRDASLAAMWGLSINFALVVIKLTGGVLFGSAALIADAVNSIGDVASALAVRGALSVAQIAEDDDHPYGHTKAESIAGLSVALLVAFSAGLLATETLQKLSESVAVPSYIAGIVALACSVSKEGIYQYTRRVAKRVDSAALRASAWDHRSDAIGSALVALALLVTPYTGAIAPYVDPIAAIGVCVILVYTGLKIFKQTATELMDQQAGDETVNAIRVSAEQVPGVIDVEKLRVRKSGMEYFVEIHIEVDGNMSVNDGHRIGHNVKDRLVAQMPRVRDVHVHIEPDQECRAESARDCEV